MGVTSGLCELLTDAASKCRLPVKEKIFEKGEYLFDQDDEAGGVYFILEGLVKSCILSENGKEVLIAISGPGEPIGDMEYFLCEPVSCSVIALERVRCLYAPRRMMETALQVSPSLCIALARVLAVRLRRSSLRVNAHLLFSLEYNLVKTVLTRFDSALPEKRTILRSELAEYLGGTERHLNRVLKGLAVKGILALSGPRIECVDAVKGRALLCDYEK